MRIVFYISVIIFALANYSIAKASIADTIRFAFLTDLHVSPGNENDSSLHNIVNEINANKLDFVVVTGDLTNTGSNAELYAVEKALKKIRHNLYVIPGNHETNWSESAGLKFNEIWKNDRFDFVCKKFNFIGFNTGPYMKMGDGHVKNEDIIWLKNKINQSSQTSNTLIAFAHYPLGNGLENWSEVTQVLNQGKCKLVFCGHGHKLSLLNFNGIPGIMGRALYMKKNDSPGYQIIELYNDSAFVYPKISSQNISRAYFQFNYQHPDTLSSIPVSTLPDFSVNQIYPDVLPFFNYQDSSSVFAGLTLYKNKILIFGNSEGFVKAIEISTKKVLWKAKFTGSLYSNPIICNNKVVFGTADGNVVGLDAESGNQIWKINFKAPVLAEAIVENESIYIGCGDSAFVAINSNNGKIKWQFTAIDGIIQGKPALYEKYIVFGAWDNYLYCINKQNGELIWKWSNGKTQKLYSPGNIVPAISNGKVFLVAPDRYMTALSIIDGTEVWRTNKYKVRESMGISRDGKTIYAKLMNDSLIAVSSESNKFELKWAINAEFGYEHSPCPIAQRDNSVVLTTKNGLVIVVDENKKKLLWIHKVCNSSANKIVIDTNKNVWITFMNGQITGFKLKY